MIISENQFVPDGDKGGVKLLLIFFIAWFLNFVQCKELRLHLLEFGLERINFAEFIFDEEGLLGELGLKEIFLFIDLVEGCHFLFW